MYQRVCAAIIRDKTILMVKLVNPGRTFWTLPGGGVEDGESYEHAVLREVWEETGLVAEVSRLLYDIEYTLGQTKTNEKCFLLKIGDQKPELGTDPEHGKNEQRLAEVDWFPLEGLKEDEQVSKILNAL